MGERKPEEHIKNEWEIKSENEIQDVFQSHALTHTQMHSHYSDFKEVGPIPLTSDNATDSSGWRTIHYYALHNVFQARDEGKIQSEEGLRQFSSLDVWAYHHWLLVVSNSCTLYFSDQFINNKKLQNYCHTPLAPRTTLRNQQQTYFISLGDVNAAASAVNPPSYPDS